MLADIGDFDHNHRLVGGRVSKPRAWLALMVIMQTRAKKRRQYNCGGTLINARNVKTLTQRVSQSPCHFRYILTAAHCLCPKSYHCKTERINLRKKRNVNVNVCIGVAQEKDCLVRMSSSDYF